MGRFHGALWQLVGSAFALFVFLWLVVGCVAAIRSITGV